MQPYTNREVVEKVEYLERHSDDLALDLALFMHIIYKRDWRGDYAGWTDVPTTWFAGKSRMGRRRVKESLDRLVEWGLITQMKGYDRFKRNAPKYRVDLWQWDDKAPNPELPEMKSRPNLKAEGNAAYGEVWKFDKVSWKLVATKTTPAEYAKHPVCKECGRVYHSTEGAGKDGTCAACTIANLIKTKIAANPEWKEGPIKTPYGEKVFSRAQALAKIDELVYNK